MGEEVAQFKGSYKVSEGLLEKLDPTELLTRRYSRFFVLQKAMMGMRPVVEFMFWSLLCCFRSNS